MRLVAITPASSAPRQASKARRASPSSSAWLSVVSGTVHRSSRFPGWYQGISERWVEVAESLRTNKHFTLKTNTPQSSDLDEFVACYNPENRYLRKPTWSEDNPSGRWRCYSYEELKQRDKVSLDTFWLRDESLEDSANPPDPDEIAAEIIEDLRAALEQLEAIQGEMAEKPVS